MASSMFPGHAAVFLLLVLVSTSTIWTGATTQSQLVTSVCRQVDEYIAGCTQVLCSNPLTCRATDLTNLTIRCLDLAIYNATKALKIVRQINKYPGTSPALKDKLAFCVWGFRQAAVSFRSANEEVRSRSAEEIGMAGYDVMTAYEGVFDCTRNLARYNLSMPELSKLDDNIYLFARIGMVLTDALVQERAVTEPVTADKAH